LKFFIHEKPSITFVTCTGSARYVVQKHADPDFPMKIVKKIGHAEITSWIREDVGSNVKSIYESYKGKIRISDLIESYTSLTKKFTTTVKKSCSIPALLQYPEGTISLEVGRLYLKFGISLSDGEILDVLKEFCEILSSKDMIDQEDEAEFEKLRKETKVPQEVKLSLDQKLKEMLFNLAQKEHLDGCDYQNVSLLVDSSQECHDFKLMKRSKPDPDLIINAGIVFPHLTKSGSASLHIWKQAIVSMNL